MFVRTQHSNEPTLYYITYTCYTWLHLFSIANAYDPIYKWFDYLKDSAQIKVDIILPFYKKQLDYHQDRGTNFVNSE